MAAFLEHASRLLSGDAVPGVHAPMPAGSTWRKRRRGPRHSGRVQAEQDDGASDHSAFYVDPVQSSASISNSSSNGSKPGPDFDPMG